MQKAVGQFEISSWEENPYFDVSAPGKATRAEIAMAFSGDLEGEGNLTYLMAYVHDGLAHYCGVLYFRGPQGNFTIIDTGTYDETGANSLWAIAPGSGTGAYAGIVGSGKAHAGHGTMMAFELDYELVKIA